MSPYVELSPSTGGGGTPGGADTQLQFNNSGAFGGSANLTWNNATSVATITGQLAINVGNASSIVAAGGVIANDFRTGALNAQLASSGAGGTVALRPNGAASATNQLLVSTTSVTTNNPVVLPADPTTALQAVTKQYVDNRVVAPATVAPLMNGTAAVGTTTKYAREDHIHPTDTAIAAKADKTYVDGQDNLRVLRSGDTMTGTLYLHNNTVNSPWMSWASSGYGSWNIDNTSGDMRFFQGSNVAMAIANGAGLVNVTGILTVNGNLSAAGDIFANSGVIRFRSDTTGKYIYHDGTIFGFSQQVTAPVVQSGTGSDGVYYFGATANAKYLQYYSPGNTFYLTGGPLTVGGDVTVNGKLYASGNLAAGVSVLASSDFRCLGVNPIYYLMDGSGAATRGYIQYYAPNNTLQITHSAATYAPGILIRPSGNVELGFGWQCRYGIGGVLGGNCTNLYWDGANVKMLVDNIDKGAITLASDYRIKKDVIDLPGMWDTVKALRPIKYTQADFSPQAHLEYRAEQARDARKFAEDNSDFKSAEASAGPMYKADDIERWGFIAHELQETLTPSASSGVKDAPDAIQSPNPLTVIAALTKALQEAMTRIEALEAR